MYRVELSELAKNDVRLFAKSSKSDYKKFMKIYRELEVHPCEGTGHPEQLKNIENGWSRRINKKDRVEYVVYEEKNYVYVACARGHYGDH